MIRERKTIKPLEYDFVYKDYVGDSFRPTTLRLTTLRPTTTRPTTNDKPFMNVKPTKTIDDLKASAEVSKLTQKAINEIDKIVGGKETVIDDPKMTKYAKASDVSYAYSYGDNEKVNSIINDMDGFEIDPNLSGRNSVTLVNPETKEVIIAYRGSDSKFADIETLTEDPTRAKNIEDWYVNALTATGKQRNTLRYKQAQQRFNDVTEAYPDFEISVTGHSNGGGQSNFIAETNNVRGYHFNPAINPIQKPAGKSTKESIVYATEGDMVSLASRVSPHPERNYTIEHVNPKVNTESDLLQLHDIDQFYTEGSPSSERVSTGRARLGMGTALAGGAVGEYMTFYSPNPSKADRNYNMTELAAETLLLPEPILGSHDFITFMVPDLLPETVAEKNAIRKHLGLKPIKEKNLNKVPQYDPLTEQIRRWTGRAQQDKQIYEPVPEVTTRPLTSFEEQHFIGSKKYDEKTDTYYYANTKMTADPNKKYMIYEESGQK